MRLRCEGPCCSLLSESAAIRQREGYAEGLCVCREALELAELRDQSRRVVAGGGLKWQRRRRAKRRVGRAA